MTELRSANPFYQRSNFYLLLNIKVSIYSQDPIKWDIFNDVTNKMVGGEHENSAPEAKCVNP